MPTTFTKTGQTVPAGPGASAKWTGPATSSPDACEPGQATAKVSGLRAAGMTAPERRDSEEETPKASDRLKEEEAAQDRRPVWLAEQGWSLDQTHEYMGREANDHGLMDKTNATHLIFTCQAQGG